MRPKIFKTLSLLLFYREQKRINYFLYKLDEKSLSRVSMGRDDFKQELLIQLYLSIQSFLTKIVQGELENLKGIQNYIFISLRNYTVNLLNKIVIKQRNFTIEFDEELFMKQDEEVFHLTEVDYECFYYKDIDILKFLGRKERVIFRRYLLGLPIKDISVRFSINQNSVLTVIHRSKNKIREGLKKGGHFGKDSL